MPEDIINSENQDQPVNPTPPTPATPPSPDGGNNGQVFGQPTNFPVPSNDNPAPKAPKSKSKKKLVMIIILLLVLLLGAAAAWKFLIYDKRDKNEVVKQETQDIELLTIGSVEGPATVFFPDEGVLGIQTLMDKQVYEGLTGFENNKIVPLLAKSWTNPDQNTWVFKLNSGVKFHTGKTLTAEDVKASLDSLKEYDYWSLFVSTIKSVEVTGDLEVTVVTESPDALLLNRLTNAYISDLGAPDEVGLNGTGAYTLDETATNDTNSTTLVAFNDYYGGHAKTRKVVVKVFATDEEIVAAVKDGTVDIGHTLPNEEVKEEIKKLNFKSVDTESVGSFGLFINQATNDEAITKNLDFRTAIAESLDRKSLAEGLKTNYTTATQIIPKSLPGHDSTISWPGFDLAQAKADLAKSGYNNQPLTFLYIKDVQVDAPIIISQLKALGLNIVEKSFTGDEQDAALDVLKAGDFDLFTAGYTSDFVDARDILGGLLHSKESSYPVFDDPDYDKILADSDKEFDPIKRLMLLQDAQKYIKDKVAWIPLRNSIYTSYINKLDLDIPVDFNGGGSLGAYYKKVGRIVN